MKACNHVDEDGNMVCFKSIDDKFEKLELQTCDVENPKKITITFSDVDGKNRKRFSKKNKNRQLRKKHSLKNTHA